MQKLLCLLLLLCLLPAAALGLADSRGVTLDVQSPQRVVCLYGSYAEAWTLAGGTLVGVTDDAITERGMACDAQIIGTTKSPNLELILSLDPDQVILSADIAAQVAAAQTLKEAGVPCAAFRVDTVQEYA